MKQLFTLIAFAVFGISAIAQTGPKIEFKQEIIDYGTVSRDDSGVRIFEFTNVGDAPLVISDVKSSCGCTVPKRPTEPVEPGKTGQIEVKYNMNPGTINKTITVMSNAVNKTDGVVLLKITGNVVVKEEVNLLEKKKSLPNTL
ncbi:DUF1573 domain-containing protein [Flavobacterium sp. NST-5]|uniref:DUF1573 domain-containing protein n=1 Tax=Flavobacterium ichthyis TaxID=2698827 RepID=A0ABW9Z8W2_9FLAO|nr:DUF1573 domain-containing protein [Flavobacterium ichthyis]NBL65312.1 DUF1573 domain-containing protein [Flavobacterium ichthyis]